MPRGWNTRSAAQRGELLIVASLCLAATIAATVVRAYPNYDTYYALVWGRELASGHLPSYTAFAAPTPHPLFNVLGALAGVVAGSHADRAIVVMCAIAHVVLGYGVYRLGSAVANRAIGTIAAVLVLSSPTFLEFVSRGYVDMPFLALVLWAGVVAAEHPENRAAPMALLTVAGLLRPEAWLLAGLLWLWHARRAGSLCLGLLGAVLVAPALWALSDLVVTGDPLYSLNATNALATTLGRPRGIAAVPGSFLSFLGGAARPLVFAGAIAGGLLAWRWRPHLRSLHVVAALLGSGTATFVISGAVGLSILPRYLTVPVVVVCLLAALMLGGWTLLLDEPGRRANISVGTVVALCVAGITYATVQSERVSDVAADVRYFVSVRDDLHAILDRPAVLAGRSCGPVSLPTYRQLPDVRWHLHAGRDSVVSRADRSARGGAIGGGVALVALGRNVPTIGQVKGLPHGTNVAPHGFTEVARNATFAAYVKCG